MAVTLREIYLNQLASGIDDPKLKARVEAEEGKLDEAEVKRASDIGGTKPRTTSSLNQTKYNELLQEAIDSEGAAPSSCPTVNWEVKYFDKETRQYETIVIPAKTSYGAEKIAQTLTNGGFYAANHATETTGGSWTSSRDTTTDTAGNVVSGGETTLAAESLPEAIVGPITPAIEKQIIAWMDVAYGYAGPNANLWTQDTDGGFVLSDRGITARDSILAHVRRENGDITANQVELVMAYYEYLEAQKGKPYMPIPQSASEYALNVDRWMANEQYYQLGYSQQDIDSFDYYKAYASQYGDLAEVKYDNLDDYLTNWNQAQAQLQNWINEAGTESFGFTDDQRRAYNMYWDYYNEYAPTGTPKPVDIGDFYNNYDYFSRQMAGFQAQGGIGGGGGGTTSGPEYWETPEYGNMATQWLEEQGQFSSALSRFTESQFPSLQRLFEAQEPRLEPYSSREGAIAEAERREGRFQSWLTGQTPEIEKKYWAQRPSERGEKLWAYSPNVRFTNWQ